MLNINLLPESARKVGPSSLEQFHRAPILWLACAGMALFVMSLVVPIHLRRRQLQTLNAAIQVLQPKKADIDQLQRLLQQLKAQESAFKRVGAGGNVWSKRLNTLSNVTPDGVWFTELNLNEDKGLVIQGSAIGQGGAEMVSVGRIVSDLKADVDFSSAIKDIQIESIKRVQEKEVELVQFTLTCFLAKQPAS